LQMFSLIESKGIPKQDLVNLTRTKFDNGMNPLVIVGGPEGFHT